MHQSMMLKNKEANKKYIVFLRGINVGGHHKVPMAQLKELFALLGYVNLTTILNSGNIIFESQNKTESKLEKEMEIALHKKFGFSIPVLLLNASDFSEIIQLNPFKDEVVTKSTRLYVSFLKNVPTQKMELPWISDDQSFRIIQVTKNAVFSVLNLEVTATPKGMESLEKFFGKDITTRNWNTLDKMKAYLSD